MCNAGYLKLTTLPSQAGCENPLHTAPVAYVEFDHVKALPEGTEYHDMARKTLVTGATGLLGRQVLKAFQEAGWDVVGTGFSRAKPPSILKLNLSDQAAISSALDEVK